MLRGDIRQLGDAVIIDTPEQKLLRSSGYNFNFNRMTGHFMRWGKTLEDDPQWSPYGPEILDLEISVNGCPNAARCGFCYKNSQPGNPTNMTLATFRKILDKMPPTLTQIAFGITGVQTNPDFLDMMRYCREKGVVPNFTLSGIDLTDEMAAECARLVGAVAVSAYQRDKNVCYDTVAKFVGLGGEQTNVHLLVSQETLPFVHEVLADRVSDPRLQGCRAIVFLGVKPKGRGDTFHSVDVVEYRKIVEFCLENKIGFGFDSCSAPKFCAVVGDLAVSEEAKVRMLQMAEPCESTLFSSYINVAGEFWHCSFSENECGVRCVDVLAADDFLKDVWLSPEVAEFRERLLACGRRCPTFPVIDAAR